MSDQVNEAVKEFEDTLRASVQDRAETTPENTAWAVPFLVQFGEATEELSAWWTPERDWELRRFAKREGLLSSTIYNMQAILSTVGWDIDGSNETAMAQARRPLDEADFGAGLKETIKKVAEDWFTQDNGFFIEIIGPGDPEGALTEPPTGIAHLDAGRCWRSGDPEFPVWYLNERTTTWHKLHWTRVAFGASNPSAMEAARGIGFCAVSRVANFATMLRDTVRYKQEKIGGRQTRALITVTGAPKEAVELAIKEAERAADNVGRIKFSALPIIAAPQAGKEITASLLELAGVPDGFDWEDELTLYMYVLALAFGIDARELWPSTASGATKADAEVQHRKAMRKGMGDFLSTLAFIFNQRIMPEGVTFAFSPKDAEEDQAQATLESTRVQTAAVMVDTGIITKKGAVTWLVNAGVLPPEYLTNTDLADPEAEPVPIIPPGEALPREEDEDDEREQGRGEPVTEDEAEKSAWWKRLLQSVGIAHPFGSVKKKAIVSFRVAVQAAIREFYYGNLSSFEFVDSMLSAITVGYRQAWAEGAAECGISFEELTEEELIALQSAINEDFQYVLGITGAIDEALHEDESAELGSLYTRGELWVNRYNAVRSQAQTMSCGDKKYRWDLGETEHCSDCLMYAGRVHRGSVWARRGIQPQSRSLACKGYRCGCRFVETNERAIPGFPPRPKGS